MDCRTCARDVDPSFRFCPWCAASLRRKLVEFFAPHARDEGRALRVSWYLTEDPHVRFSIWSETGVAECALSVGEPEARRLGELLIRRSAPRRRRLEQLVEAIRR